MGKDVSHIKLPVMHLNLEELPRPESIDVSNNYDPAESRRILREIIESNSELNTVPVNLQLQAMHNHVLSHY
jgi:hypothetical protein